jgi:hypothetical protein
MCAVARALIDRAERRIVSGIGAAIRRHTRPNEPGVITTSSQLCWFAATTWHCSVWG